MIQEEISGADKLKDTAHHGVVMAENGAFKSATKVAESRLEGSARTAVAESASSHGLVDAMKEHAGGMGIGIGVAAGVTQWDYVRTLDETRKGYNQEIAAKLGKPHHLLTNGDLTQVAKQNAVIGDAVSRARRKRNIGLVVGTIAVVAAFVVAAAVMAPVAGFFATMATGLGATGVTGAGIEGVTFLSGIMGMFGAGSASTLGVAGSAAAIAKSMVVGGAGVAAYMATEKAANAVAEPLMGLREPSMKKVLRDSGLQDKLSLSSQVDYIAHLQKRTRPGRPETMISQEQVLKVFLKANKGTSEAIKQRYGADFSSLPPEQRAQIITTLGKDINLEQLTSDLNNHQVRAQELAFTVQGQSSGVPRREAPRVAQLEKSHNQMEQQLQQARSEINNMKMAMRANSTQMGNTAPVQQQPSRSDDLGPATNRILEKRRARMQQQQQQGAAIV